MNVTVPGTNFTFLSLGLFVLVISFAIGLFRFMLGLPLHAAESLGKETMINAMRRTQTDDYKRR